MPPSKITFGAKKSPILAVKSCRKKRIFARMNELIDLFTQLGAKLRMAGNDPRWKAAKKRATEENPWFTEREVDRATNALVRDMLDGERLREWLSGYAVPVAVSRNILVVMAGNIPLVGFFDLMCVLLSGHRCLVKPSKKDRALMEEMVRTIRELTPKAKVELYDGSQPIDALIATGSDNAERYFKAHYAGVDQLLRGSRQSVAVLAGDETKEELAGLADDIWAYSGLGCRNVSLIFAPEGYRFTLEMPQGMNPKYRNNYLQQRALLRMRGVEFEDLGEAVLTSGREFPVALSEVVVARYKSLDEVRQWLSEHDRELQCIVSHAIEHPRCVGLGCAQSPALNDYPDAVDVIAWLTRRK